MAEKIYLKWEELNEFWERIPYLWEDIAIPTNVVTIPKDDIRIFQQQTLPKSKKEEQEIDSSKGSVVSSAGQSASTKSVPKISIIYPDNILSGPYHVSLTIPGPISNISKSIGMTSSTSLLIPNIDYLTKFIEGDIGIGDSILKSMLSDNYNSPIAKKDENVFKNFSKLNKIELDDLNRYKKANNFIMPEENIKISPEFDRIGLKSIEKATLKSIFETQKPYIEVAKLIIENLVKIEDIIARVMPILSISPLSSKSEKPIVNSGNNNRPNSLGNKSEEVKNKISKLQAFSNKGSSVTIDKNGKAKRVNNKVGKSDNDGNYSEISGNWETISTIYSTGTFDPNVEYRYRYVHLKDEEDDLLTEDIDFKIEDPFQKHKPKTIILGIFDSKGNPLNPKEKLKYLDFNDNNAVSNISRAEWILRSPKWIYGKNDFDQTKSYFGNPFFIWERSGSPDKTSTNNPDPNATVKGSGDSRTVGNNPAWKTKKYKKGDKNKLNKLDAVEGDPIILKFQSNEITTYSTYFKEMIDLRISNSDLEDNDKSKISKQIIEQVDIPSFLQSVFLYGDVRSSVYKKINGRSPFPDLMRISFKPIRAKSSTISSDKVLSNFLKSRGQRTDEVWIDPEADYKMKVIRVDPTSKIRYKSAEGEPEIEANIRSFVRNTTNFKISDSRPFNIEIKKIERDIEIIYDSVSNVTEYDLENWNYIDEDGVVSIIGQINRLPRRNDTITYKIEIWSDRNTPYYNRSDYFTWEVAPFEFAELEKKNNFWTYNEFKFFAPINEIALNTLFSKINSGRIRSLYDRFKSSNNSTETETNILSRPFNLKSSSDYSVSLVGDQTDYFRYSKEIIFEYLEKETKATINSYSYSSTTNETIIIVNENMSLITATYWSITRIVYNIPIDVIFSKKVISSITKKVRLEPDNSLVYVKDNKVEKWIHMNSNEESIDYANGDFNSTNLPQNSKKRNINIDISQINNINLSDEPESESRFMPPLIVTDEQINKFSIRVENSNGSGAIIDPSRILNSQLSRPEKYSNGKYGHGSKENPQEIDVIYRYMLTELDTESYYIIEGILNEESNDSQVTLNSSGNISDDSRWYRIKHSIGAIKQFISVLVDIFSKLLPNMQKLIKLFKNPPSFVTEIISDKLSESVSFLSKESMETFKRGLNEQRNIESISDPKERVRKVKSLRDLFKNSDLSNYVYVSDEGKIISILDGISTIPFSIFGLSVPFGMQFEASGNKPLDLVLPKDLKNTRVKNLQQLFNVGLDDSIESGNISSDISNVNKKKNKIDSSQVNFNTSTNDRKSDSSQIKFNDGTSILLNNASLDQFIIDNKTKYSFVFIEETYANKLKNIDALLDSGSEDDLKKASDELTNLSKSKLNDPLIEDRFKRLNRLRDIISTTEQPLLKMILGMVTLPIKIIGGILEWLIDFFKSLSNPLTLPTKIAELLSFKWIINFFTPKGILEMAGIKFNPDKIPEWKALVNIRGRSPILPKTLKLSPDIKLKGFNPMNIKNDGYLLSDASMIDLSEFLNVSFLAKLPNISALQHRQNTNSPMNILSGFLCLVEKIINAIIDFIWSTLGLEAIIKPPHIKLCSKNKTSNNGENTKSGGNSENNANILNGGSNPNLSNFIYEVKLENGETKEFLNREELDKFIENNSDINYDFNF